MEELMMEGWTEEEEHVGEESSPDDTMSDSQQDDSDSILEDGSEDASQDASEDGEESSSTDGAEESVAEGDTEESSSVDVGELVELLKNYTDDTAEESLKEADADTATPEAPTAVTDEATVETLTEIHSVLNDMSVSMNSIYADTAAYQTQSLEYAQKSEIWLSGIFIALVVVGIGVCINVGLKMADIFFGRMRT